MTTNLPAYLQNLPSRGLAQTAIANVGAGTPPYLSIQGGRFTLIDVAGNSIPAQKMDPQGNIYIDVAIVDVNNHVSKIFFGLNKPYDPDNPTPPICFSDNGVAPSTGSGQPQSPTCASCAHNVWGSKISQMGSQVKQCADQQKIAVYAPDYSDGVFLLRIPPGSFANWRAYMAKFASAGFDPDRVITRISFEQNAVGTLLFQSPGYITEQMAGTVARMIESKAADPMIGKLDRPREAALPAPQTQILPAVPASTVNAVMAAQPDPLPVHSAVPQTPFPPPQTAITPAVVPAQTVQIQQPVQPPQRRRRTKAEMEAARATQGQPAQQPVQTAQISAQPVQAPFRPDPAPQAAQPQFGIVQNPPAPPSELDLDAVFK